MLLVGIFVNGVPSPQFVRSADIEQIQKIHRSRSIWVRSLRVVLNYARTDTPEHNLNYYAGRSPARP